MEIEITTAKGAKIEKIEIKKRLETFSIKLDGKPREVTFDKDEKIPLKLVKLQPLSIL
jgi:hypothetical protein